MNPKIDWSLSIGMKQARGAMSKPMRGFAPVLATLAAVAAGTVLYLGIRKVIKKRSGKVKGKVSALYVYPIKSCGGVQVKSRAIEARGFLCDRLYMLVDGTTNSFITQRQVSDLARIRPALPEDPDQPLEVNAPGMSQLTVPVVKEGPVLVVRVWGDQVEAIDQGEEAAKWFSTFLHKEGVRLVRFRDGYRREVERDYAGKGYYTGFSDGYPFLVVSEASLEDLNKRLSQPIPMNRFRPNIVVSGVAPFEEDGWDEIRVGDVPMRIVKPCSRCKMPTIDQETGIASEEPSKTLRTFRSGEVLKLKNSKWKNEWFFAQNAVHDRSSGSIAVGDDVIVYPS